MGTDDTSARADDEAASVAELFVPIGEDEVADDDGHAADEPAPPRMRFRALWFVALALVVVPALWVVVRA